MRFVPVTLLGWVLGEAAFFATFFLLIYESPRGLVPTAGVEPLGPAGEPGVTLRVTHGF